MIRNNFYKKGYLIAVYDDDERLQIVCDNVDEFAKVYKTPKNIAKSIIHKTTSGKQNIFYHCNEKLSIVLIPLDPEEIKELLKEKG